LGASQRNHRLNRDGAALIGGQVFSWKVHGAKP
jgi:hypothetical protein